MDNNIQNTSEHTNQIDSNPKVDHTRGRESVERNAGRVAPALFILFAIVSVGFGAAGFYGWQQLTTLQSEQQRLALAQADVRQLEEIKNLSRQITNLSGIHEQLSQRIESLEQGLKEEKFRLSSVTEHLAKITNNEEVDWQLAQLEYYTLLAHKRLKLTHDLPGAIVLLDESINIAKDIEEPQALSIMQALESDKTRLSTVVDVNVEHVFIQIDELIKQISQLVMPELKWDWHKPTAGDEATTASQKTTATHFSDVEGWHGHVDLALERMATFFSQSLVRTQTLDKPIQPLLPPEQRVYLQQNLQLILEQAQLSALRRQGGNYKVSLEQAQRWLVDYFRDDTASAQYMKKTIAQLIKLDMNPQIPEISSSINAVKSFSKEWLNIKQNRHFNNGGGLKSEERSEESESTDTNTSTNSTTETGAESV